MECAERSWSWCLHIIYFLWIINFGLVEGVFRDVGKLQSFILTADPLVTVMRNLISVRWSLSLACACNSSFAMRRLLALHSHMCRQGDNRCKNKTIIIVVAAVRLTSSRFLRILILLSLAFSSSVMCRAFTILQHPMLLNTRWITWRT